METHFLKPLQHDIFLSNGSPLSHGFFNCHGGNSLPPFSSNNVSYGVGDDEKAIVCNRHGIKTYLGVSLLLSAHQTHGDKIFHL
ncbi:MAG: laccase domain-containing protein, partial [Bacteroidetes bacterium]|nr:laccase domain-containing protein [Bacteroidota bacterium]